MRKKGRTKSPPFVMIEKRMLESEAWEKIGNAARVAYVHLKAKTFSPNPQVIVLSFQEMERVMTHPTFSKAISELEGAGFIEIIQRGGLYRRRNLFKLSDRWKVISKETLPVEDISGKETLPIQGKKLYLLRS